MKRLTPKKKIGLVVVMTGHGKGKTTAALGMILRAVGYGMKVCLIQFVKGDLFAGEYEGLKNLKGLVEHHLIGKGFVGIMGDTHTFGEHRETAQQAVKLVKEKLVSGVYDLVICDEINNALQLKLIDLAQILDLLTTKPAKTHLVLTGRDAHPEVIAKAHTVSEVVERKHAFHEGIEPQEGIDI